MKHKTSNKQWKRVHGDPHIHRYEVSNRQFAEQDNGFRAKCERAGVEPTKRQASRFRNKKGAAFRWT